MSLPSSGHAESMVSKTTLPACRNSELADTHTSRFGAASIARVHCCSCELDRRFPPDRLFRPRSKSPARKFHHAFCWRYHCAFVVFLPAGRRCRCEHAAFYIASSSFQPAKFFSSLLLKKSSLPFSSISSLILLSSSSLNFR